jgi:hypothetical protein
MTYVLAYSNQNDDTIKELTLRHPHILICLDSGTSFRNKALLNSYIPTNNQLRLTKRPNGVEFIQFPDCEARDLMALWLIKNKIEQPKRSTKAQISKILLGNSVRGIPELASPENSKNYTDDIHPDAPLWQAFNFIEDEFGIPYFKLNLNNELFSLNLNTFMAYLPDFETIYDKL